VGNVLKKKSANMRMHRRNNLFQFLFDLCQFILQYHDPPISFIHCSFQIHTSLFESFQLSLKDGHVSRGFVCLLSLSMSLCGEWLIKSLNVTKMGDFEKIKQWQGDSVMDVHSKMSSTRYLDLHLSISLNLV